jgi:hypothetical protein
MADQPDAAAAAAAKLGHYARLQQIEEVRFCDIAVQHNALFLC